MVVATFRSVIDMTVNNSYQIYWQSHLNPGKYTLNAVGFRQAMVDAYYRLYRKSFPSITLFTSSCSLRHPANNMQFDSFNHRIAKGSQRQCSLPGCKETSVYSCKKFNFVFMLNVLNYITEIFWNIAYKIIERWNIKLFSSLRNICLRKVAEKSFYTRIFEIF